MKKIIKSFIFIFVFLIFSAGIIYLNMIKDPYGIKSSNNNNNLDLYYLRKDLYYTALNFTKNNKYDYVIIGGSQMNNIIAPIFFRNKKIAKITLPYISIEELYNLLSYYLKFHPETKNIIVSLEFSCYSYCHEGYSIPLKPTNKLNDFIKIYYSLDSTKKSLNSIFDNLNLYIGKNEQQNNNQENNNLIPYNDKIRYIYHNNICLSEGLEGFKKVYSLINNYKLNAYYVLPPTNALFLADLYKQGFYTNLEKFKKEIAQITPYYDMAFINHYTKKPIKYIFYDAVHVNSMFLGKQFLDIILNNNIDKNLAEYVTKNNVNNILRKQKQDFLKYMEENKKAIEYYTNLRIDKKYDLEYASLNDMPQEETELYNYNLI